MRSGARSLQSPSQTLAHRPPWSTRTQYECCAFPHWDIWTPLKQNSDTLDDYEKEVTEKCITYLRQAQHSNKLIYFIVSCTMSNKWTID
jgi:hypothetical protein